MCSQYFDSVNIHQHNTYRISDWHTPGARLVKNLQHLPSPWKKVLFLVTGNALASFLFLSHAIDLWTKIKLCDVSKVLKWLLYNRTIDFYSCRLNFTLSVCTLQQFSLHFDDLCSDKRQTDSIYCNFSKRFDSVYCYWSWDLLAS